MLEATGYTIIEADDTESGLAILQASRGDMIVLFNIALFDNMIAGTDGITFLGAAAIEQHVAHQHAFVIVTPTPDQVEAALGRLLSHLSVPVIAEPIASDELLCAVATASRRLLISA